MIQVHVAGTPETPQSIILQPFLNLLELFAIVFPNNNFMIISHTEFTKFTDATNDNATDDNSTGYCQSYTIIAMFPMLLFLKNVMQINTVQE